METPRIGPTGETIDTPRHRALGSTSRVSILRLVQESPGGITAAEVAARTGQHLSTTRAHLDRLTDSGLLVKARASGGQPGRPAWRYRAAAGDPAPAPAPYRALAAALLDHLTGAAGDVRDAAARVGQEWGRHLAAAGPRRADPVGSVVTVLDGLGFGPRRQPAPAGGTEAEVHLHTCPFLELVGRSPDAMCGLHLGVVRGILEHDGASPDAVVLEPFGAPDACVVRLLTPAPPAPGGRP
ncbi:helix-turn-helix transcriptional regulator [Actinoplanes sp. NPDC049599]|uniref:helix-turn-helix transcriptional regulator n=1 Tax=Actinoplanes sp. NPDC049599 TaxID=3363903 RepID=UPI00379E1344